MSSPSPLELEESSNSDSSNATHRLSPAVTEVRRGIFRRPKNKTPPSPNTWGLKGFSQEHKKGIERFGKSMERGFKEATQEHKKGIECFGKSIERSVETALDRTDKKFDDALLMAGLAIVCAVQYTLGHPYGFLVFLYIHCVFVFRVIPRAKE